VSRILVTNAPVVPARTPFPTSGTITSISCNGPITATIYDRANVPLYAIDSRLDGAAPPYSVPLCIALDNGASIVQQTPDSIVVIY
jgi:hypothetical protein